jgi:hypothetical protein
MSKKKLVTCGCSFTQQDGWAKHIKNYYEYFHHLNLAIGAGTNNTQINRINDFILSNPEPFDLVWQITYPSRTSNMRLSPDHPDVVTKNYKPRIDRGFTYAQVSPIKNFIDDQKHVDILYDGYVLPRQEIRYANINNDVSQLLCTMMLVSKFAQHLMIFFGVDDIEQMQVDRMQEFFGRANIPFVPYQHNLLGYVKHHQLGLAEDHFHPAKQSYVTWADSVLIPAISQQWKN